MRRLCGKSLWFVSCCWLWTHSAYALISVEAGVGYTKYSVKPEGAAAYDIPATTLGASVYLDPIPLVPIALGVHAEWDSLNTDKFPVKPETGASLQELSVDVKAWIPAVPVFTPYAKLRYVAFSRMQLSFPSTLSAEVPELNVNANVKGWSVIAGLEKPLLPMIGLFVEGQYGAREWSQPAGAKAVPMDVLGVTVGVNVGL
jgi:hypothetical protein